MDNLVPIIFGDIYIKYDTDKTKIAKILLDSGASSSIIKQEYVQNLKIKNLHMMSGKLWRERLKRQLRVKLNLLFQS